MPNSLFITADDIGATLSIDKAVIDLIEKGVLNSISIFVNGCTDLSWVEKYLNKIRIGLHLTFSFGLPLTNINDSHIVNNCGFFNSPKKPTVASNNSIKESIENFLNNFNNSDYNSLFNESIAQYKKFCQLFSKDPDFICVHHDLDKCTTLQKVIKEAFPNNATRELLKNDNDSGYMYLYDFLNTNQSYNESTKQIVSLLNRGIENIRTNNVEVVFHPAFISSDLIEFSTYNLLREREYEILMSEEISSLLNQKEI